MMMRWAFRLLLALSVVLVFVLGLVGRHFQDLALQYHAGDYVLDLLWRPPPPQPHVKQPAGVGDKVIVMAALEEEKVDWVESELPDWQRAIYIVNPSRNSSNDPSVLTTPANKGHESMAYLSYIIDHYDSLPSTIAFIHSHRHGFLRAWHVDAPLHDNAIAMRSLQLDFVQRNGYVNLRCNWNPGCLNLYHSNNSHVTEEVWQEIFEGTTIATETAFADETESPTNQSRASPSRHGTRLHRERQKKLKAPANLGVACCAQFAVSREQVLKRPLDDYVRFRKWIMQNERNNSGRVLEYLWHIIFGMDPVYCPDESLCYCQVYGRC